MKLLKPKTTWQCQAQAAITKSEEKEKGAGLF
jgi:hypothetical protein